MELTTGPTPTVRFTVAGAPQSETADLVVGADGRNSLVRRLCGIDMQRAPATHLMSGLLVEGAGGWPITDDAIATVGDLNFTSLPQGDGQIRLYINHGLDSAHRFAGPAGQQRFLDAFSTAAIPGAASLVDARPAGPCATFKAEDTWCSAPYAPGVVLIGDAAGYTDPIAGQGLSLALRDVRLVSEALRSAELLHAETTFAGYAADRLERMRRVRFVAQTMAAVLAEFGPDSHARRLRALQRMQQDERLAMWFAAVFVGPYNVPDEAFHPSVRTRLVAA